MVFSKLKKVFKEANDCNNLGRADWCMENSSDCVWCANNIQKGPLSEGKCIKKKNLRDRKDKPSQCPGLNKHVPTEEEFQEWKSDAILFTQGALKKIRKSNKDKKDKKTKKTKKTKKAKKPKKPSHKSNKRRRTIRRRR